MFLHIPPCQSVVVTYRRASKMANEPPGKNFSKNGGRAAELGNRESYRSYIYYHTLRPPFSLTFHPTLPRVRQATAARSRLLHSKKWITRKAREG